MQISANIIDGWVTVDGIPRRGNVAHLAARFDAVEITDALAYAVKDGNQFGIDRAKVAADLMAAWNAAAG
jgi:hypothetical protein